MYWRSELASGLNGSSSEDVEGPALQGRPAKRPKLPHDWGNFVYNSQMKRAILWLVPTFLYIPFLLWYTNISGALTEEEIDRYMAAVRTMDYTLEQQQRLEQFMRADEGKQFLMLNNIDMNEQPPAVEGAAPGESADQLLAHYMEFMFPELLKRASHPVYMGHVVHTAMDLIGMEGQGAATWDQAALMRYRSRRDLVEIASNPAFQGRHEYKVAALTKTIAYPLENDLYLSDPRLLLALLLFALTALLDMALFRRLRS